MDEKIEEQNNLKKLYYSNLNEIEKIISKRPQPDQSELKRLQEEEHLLDEELKQIELEEAAQTKEIQELEEYQKTVAQAE